MMSVIIIIIYWPSSILRLPYRPKYNMCSKRDVMYGIDWF